nr:ribosomal protein L23 [Arundo donax]
MGIKYAVFTEKSLRLLRKNQYTSNIESGFTKTEIKHWVELFFGVKVVAVNSHRLPGKGRRMGPILGHTMHYRRMIITLQPGILSHFYFLLKGILKEVFLSF